MQDPEPNGPKSGWVPTTSTIAGAGVGGCIAYLIIRVVDAIFHTPFNALDYVALTTICNGIAGYLFPDGGRK